MEIPAGQLKLITLDVGGTLIHPHPSVGEVYAEVLERRGIRLAPAEIERRFRGVFAGLRSGPRPHVDDAEEKRFWLEVVGEIIGESCDRKEFPEIFEELFETFSVPERWRIADGAFETIRALKERGYRLAILSNADSRIRRLLDRLEILSEIPDAFISAEIGFEKPDLRIFRHVERALGSDRGEILHVGDSDFHDGGGAREAGWQVLILGGEFDLEAGRISRLADLLEVPDLSG